MIFLVAIACLFFFQGLWGVYHFVIWMIQWKQSQEWSSTRGKITQSNLKTVQVPIGGRKGHNFDGSPRMRLAYIPDIVYTYRANTGEFQSRQIYFGQSFPSTLDISCDLIKKYPEDNEITVYYNPDKPEMATLERNRRKDLFPYLVGGLIFIFIGFVILVQALHG